MTPKEMYENARMRLYDQPDAVRNFYADAEAAFGFAHFSDKLKSRIHTLAYEQGHSAGYGDIITQYFDLVDLAHLAIDEYPNMKQLQK